MLGIVRLFLQLPEVRLHGFYTARLILLSGERGLVSGDLHEVFGTSRYCCCHRREAVTNTRLVGTQRSAAFVTLGAKRINALTIGVRGCCLAVGCHQIITVIVTVLFLRSFATPTVITAIKCSAFAEQVVTGQSLYLFGSLRREGVKG